MHKKSTIFAPVVLNFGSTTVSGGQGGSATDTPLDQPPANPHTNLTESSAEKISRGHLLLGRGTTEQTAFFTGDTPERKSNFITVRVLFNDSLESTPKLVDQIGFGGRNLAGEFIWRENLAGNLCSDALLSK